MELKSRSFTSKEPHVAREPQVADPWPRWLTLGRQLLPESISHTSIQNLLRSKQQDKER
jgi:hypothetical protein